jgi:hypothetical protein
MNISIISHDDNTIHSYCQQGTVDTWASVDDSWKYLEIAKCSKG